MPLYEYHCQQCDHHFEKIERASIESTRVCPSCGGSARRLLGAPALKFKGSGWYVTDYGKGNGGASASGETSTSPAASSTAETGPADSSKVA